MYNTIRHIDFNSYRYLMIRHHTLTFARVQWPDSA